jgi:hypothetical protein
MIFTVAYRNTSGKKEYIVVETESRHMLFEKLKEQQITPIQIFSGNQQYKLLKKSDKSNYTFKVIFISLCAIVTVSLVSIVSINPDLFIKKEKNKPTQKTIIKSSNRNYISKTEVDQKKIDTPIHSTNITSTTAPTKQLTITNSVGNTSRFGTFYPNNKRKPPRKLFKRYSENYIAGLLRTKPGMAVIGTVLPPNFDDDFKQSLSESIIIEKDDSPEDIEIKEMMKSIKESAKKIIGEGGSIRETIIEERKYLQKIAEMRHTLQREVSRKRKEGASEQELNETIESANQIMKEYGGLEIKLSPFRYRNKE